MTDEIRRPDPALLRRGARFGQHVRPDRGDDMLIEQLVAAVCDPQPPRRPGDPALVQQLLDRAPRPELLGVDDWERPLRADEIAEVWGTPLEGPDTRLRWLQRAQEIAQAWGLTLFGPAGVRPDVRLDPRGEGEGR